MFHQPAGEPLFGTHCPDKETSLKYAYAFLKCDSLKMKECAFVNPKPTQIDPEYILPRDTYTAKFTDETLPSWEEFKTNKQVLESPGFMCVACVDDEDRKRVNLVALGGDISYQCFGNHKKEANKAMDEIKRIVETL